MFNKCKWSLVALVICTLIASMQQYTVACGGCKLESYSYCQYDSEDCGGCWPECSGRTWQVKGMDRPKRCGTSSTPNSQVCVADYDDVKNEFVYMHCRKAQRCVAGPEIWTFSICQTIGEIVSCALSLEFHCYSCVAEAEAFYTDELNHICR